MKRRALTQQRSFKVLVYSKPITSPTKSFSLKIPFKNLLVLVWRQSVRNTWRNPLAALLNTASLAIGVAVFVAVQTANHSVARSFEAGVDVLAGRADLEITGLAGRFDESCLPIVVSTRGVTAASPVLRACATIPGKNGEYLEILGIDPFTHEPFHGRLFASEDNSFDLDGWLAKGGVVLSPIAAKRLATTVGEEITLLLNGRSTTVPVVGVWSPVGAQDGRFAWMDIAWVQERFGLRGQLSSILIKTEKGSDASMIAQALSEVIPPNAITARPSRRGEQVLKMTAGFRLNLQAMSGVSLLVGAFLIYGTVSASVVRRRMETGILRAVGLGQNGVKLLFLAEAVALGAPGIPLGVLFGVVLGNGLLGAVSTTVSSLYVASAVEAFFIPWEAIILGIFSGLASIIAGAWLPASEAANANPVDILHMGRLREQTSGQPLRILIYSAFCSFFACTFSWFAIESGPPWLGFISAFFVLAAGSLLIPPLIMATAPPLALLASHFGILPLRLAATGLVRSLHRISVTGAALSAAIALATGVAIMIHSFRESMSLWADQVIAADVFVGLDVNETAGSVAYLPDEIPFKLKSLQGVIAVETYSRIEIEVNGLPMDLAVIDGEDRGRFRFLGGRPGHFERWTQERAAVISESAARRLNLREADKITLPSPAGPLELLVAGVFRDYTSDKGLIMVRRPLFEKFWRESRSQSAAIYLSTNIDRPALAEKISEQILSAGWAEGLRVYTNAGLRNQISAIFEQTFTVTKALRYVAMVVALTGVLLSLATLVVERSRELATLRAQGMSFWGIAALVIYEAQILAAVAALAGLIAGIGLAAVLTGVINRAFFGWTIDWAVPWGILLQTPLWIALSAFVAALWPALRAARASLTRALREE